jgi:vacuolar-type H+-ATPase subunit H
MEKVWPELKRIEAQADQIREEAESKSKEISATAEQDAERLLTNSKTYAEEDGQNIQEAASAEAFQNREAELKASQETIENMTKKAKRHIDEAASTVVSAVLGEAKDASHNQAR